MVGRYNAEGNRSTATPELLRCNVKVIRPVEQASDGSTGQPGQTSSPSVTVWSLMQGGGFGHPA